MYIKTTSKIGIINNLINIFLNISFSIIDIFAVKSQFRPVDILNSRLVFGIITIKIYISVGYTLSRLSETNVDSWDDMYLKSAVGQQEKC
jgi:hypothetical protein